VTHLDQPAYSSLTPPPHSVLGPQLHTMTIQGKRNDTRRIILSSILLCLGLVGYGVAAFSSFKVCSTRHQDLSLNHAKTCIYAKSTHDGSHCLPSSSTSHRRQLLQWGMVAFGCNLVSTMPVKADLYEEPTSVKGNSDPSLSLTTLPLYYILRVREATEQESRLISSGKFKDVQRANVKLAVRFMLQNYKLSDNIIAAAATLSDSNKRQTATETGQRAVENLFTILEYFDSRDVENLKVGTYDSMAGKEPLVLKGLESARANIDEFLTYFDSRTVDMVRQKIDEENELNAKEFDPSLGAILNPNPRK